MAFKTLTIKKEVYDKLIKAKPKNESFSQFLGKLVEAKRTDIMRFAGAWKDMPEEEFSRIQTAMKAFRESLT